MIPTKDKNYCPITCSLGEDFARSPGANVNLVYCTSPLMVFLFFVFVLRLSLDLLLSFPNLLHSFFSIVTLASFCGNFFPFILNCLHQLKNFQVSSPPSQIFSHRRWLGFLSDLVWDNYMPPNHNTVKKKNTHTQNLFFQKYFLG